MKNRRIAPNLHFIRGQIRVLQHGNIQLYVRNHCESGLFLRADGHSLRATSLGIAEDTVRGRPETGGELTFKKSLCETGVKWFDEVADFLSALIVDC